ncbi:beta-ketoacyl-[acyl-carrier-protein] synthase family protein [Marixanthomonas spongiae]|uniref:Beta-ketoacyl-[acyl-carrier-protein] synthase family protein n=1 Tax=Marixanthomonas spongiae TaxID=2174845 RepID=A0A2U0HZL6_9FLAO|nr:beta-ketoacyl-[acyl-carrier-protein] synthase family protein [Marixanthomonas spongiae]PVW14315.1 beta-ketoacyl-[acyl-carrier-protein] synthase family protein [Marixanthomonas spongiae]
MKNQVAITGMGIVSAIGNSVEQNLQALLTSKSGIGISEHIQTLHKDTIKVGEVSFTNAEMVTQLNLPENNNYTRTALLGCLAAKEAVQNAQIKAISAYKTGLISATTVGGMDMTETYWKQFATDPEVQKYISSHHAGDSTEKIATSLGITDFVTTISTACSSAANAIMLGARLVKAGKLDRVVVGGTDALSKFTINGFKSLMILSKTNCTPFDANRNGLNLGEAAAYLVLESDEVVAAQNKSVLSYVSGYGNANDAFHQTASSKTGDGAYLSMKKALKVAGLPLSAIDYVNAHGTATQNNDLSESIALQRIFGKNVPKFSSTKGFTGHTLAAAGAVEAVLSVLSLQQNTVFANLGFTTAMPETGLTPVTQLQKKELKHVLSNSFGFGGNCSTLLFSK